MTIDATAQAMTRYTPVVAVSSPRSNQEAKGSSEHEGQKLPVEGKHTPQVQAKSEQAQVPNDLELSVREINEFIQFVQRELSFNLDEASGRTVIKVIDRDSEETIRQMPSEQMLAIASQIRDVRDRTISQAEIPAGLLFSETA